MALAPGAARASHPQDAAAGGASTGRTPGLPIQGTPVFSRGRKLERLLGQDAGLLEEPQALSPGTEPQHQSRVRACAVEVRVRALGLRPQEQRAEVSTLWVPFWSLVYECHQFQE